MAEVQQGIHQINTPLGERDNFVYAFVGSDQVLIFDTGCDGAIVDDVEPYLASIGVEASRVGWVFASHCDVDHFGGLGSARERFPNARLGAHALDAPLMEDYDTFENERGNGFVDTYGIETPADGMDWMRSVTRTSPLDVWVRGGERIRLGDDWSVDVLHVPGHSRGHLAIWDSRSRAVVVSDAVLSDAVRLADGTPAFPPTYRYVSAYRGTISAIGSLGFESMYTAHYPDMDRGDGRQFLDTSSSFVDRAEAAVLRALAERPLTTRELIDEINGGLGAWPEAGTAEALAFPVVGHIEDLLATHRVEQDGERDGTATWAVAS